MNILDSNNIHECTSCQVCALLCTPNAISYSIDSNGFYRPIVDENKCVDCGLCKKVCYKYTEIEPFVFDEHVYHYAAASTDENTLCLYCTRHVAELAKLGYRLSFIVKQTGILLHIRNHALPFISNIIM